MAENDKQMGVLGGGPAKYNIGLVRTAVRRGYPIKNATRRLIVEQMAEILGNSESERSRIAAAKTLLAADGLNIRREEVDILDRHADNQDATAALRLAMASPEARKVMAEMSDAVCEGVQGVEVEVTEAIKATGMIVDELVEIEKNTESKKAFAEIADHVNGVNGKPKSPKAEPPKTDPLW